MFWVLNVDCLGDAGTCLDWYAPCVCGLGGHFFGVGGWVDVSVGIGVGSGSQQLHHTPHTNLQSHGSYNVDVHIVNDFTFLFNGDEYQGMCSACLCCVLCVRWRRSTPTDGTKTKGRAGLIQYAPKRSTPRSNCYTSFHHERTNTTTTLSSNVDVPAVNWWREEVYKVNVPSKNKNFSTCPLCSRMPNPCVLFCVGAVGGSGGIWSVRCDPSITQSNDT